MSRVSGGEVVTTLRAEGGPQVAAQMDQAEKSAGKFGAAIGGVRKLLGQGAFAVGAALGIAKFIDYMQTGAERAADFASAMDQAVAAFGKSAAASASGLTGIDAQMQQLVDAADAARKQIADKAAAKSGETPILSFFGLGDMTTEQISAYMLSAMERVNRDLEAARSKLRATKAKEEQDAAIKQAESLSLELAAIAQKNADFEEKLWEGINKAREEENQRLQEEYMRNLEERKKAELDAIGEYARALSGAITQANQQQQSFINGQLDGIAQTVTKIQQLVQIKLGK